MTRPDKNIDSREVKNLKGKLNALSGILRLGHEAFQKSSLEQLGSHIVNNSRLIAGYDRAALVDMRSVWPRLVSVVGQPEVNKNSEYSINLLNLLRCFYQLERVVVVSREVLEEFGATNGAYDALKYFDSYNDKIVLIPMRSPEAARDGGLFIWVVEFFDREEKNPAGLLPLLGQHYNEALWYVLKSGKTSLPALFGNRRKAFSTPRLLLGAAIIFIICLFAVRIKQNVSAEFEVVPGRENYYYAPYDGIIKRCYYRSGDRVKPGEEIVEYDTEELQFRLADAQKSYDEASAELDLVQRMSFQDVKLRGRVKLLELKKKRDEVNIEKNKWLLDKSKVVAEQSGILDIGERDKLEGKAVRSGDKLFEILSTNDLEAQIMVNEQNASVLNDTEKLSVSLYLHNRPEMGLEGEIVSISPKPVLTDKKFYCYIIRMKLNRDQSGLICGMRGVARVAGSRVSLGYYLFRNLVLWWRRV